MRWRSGLIKMRSNFLVINSCTKDAEDDQLNLPDNVSSVEELVDKLLDDQSKIVDSPAVSTSPTKQKG